ncbi:hypothetical protein [Sphingosinicella sp.]|uniref:hypothetical protein n=1 Tax=Sphingosinicella sp. TaxID=1917971 RepID=UPI004037A4C2
MARIDCRQCQHSVVLSAPILERMVGRLANLSTVEKRLRGTRCSGRGGTIGVIYPRGR